MSKKAITKKQFTALNELYNYYNRRLFNNQLPECLVSLVRAHSYHGTFAPNRWKEKNGDAELVHEITLNANTMTRPDKEWHSTLVHEMVHLYISVFHGNRSRGYHCKRWAAMMKHVGLQASHNGKPGGRETGRRVTHYIIEDAPFEKAFNNISEKDIAKYRLPYQSLVGISSSPVTIAAAAPGAPVPESKSGVKVGYECACGCKVWGKENLHLMCMDCNNVFSTISSTIKSTFQ